MPRSTPPPPGPRPTPAAAPRRPWDQNATWRWIRSYFGFSKAETRGFVGLVALLVVFAVAPILLRPDDPVYLPEQDQEILNRWSALVLTRMDAGAREVAAERTARRGAYSKNRGGRGGAGFAAVAPVRLAPFDPNTLTAEGWEARGVPPLVAGRIYNYGQKAGGFKSKAQVKRIYGLEDSTYQRLAPFMQLPEEAPRRGGGDYAAAGRSGRPWQDGGKPYVRKPRHLKPFDLNLADTTQLQQIRGIGRGRAKWIVKVREDFGGYISQEQLKEVFVLREAPDLVDSLRKYTFIAPGFKPRQVNINTATFDEMWTQPCIGKNLARMIVAYRIQHGPYKTVEGLRELKLLKEESFVKMRPYVRCE